MKNSQLKKTSLVTALLLATGAQAATINVDGVTCTLNDAVTAANTDTATGGCDAGSGADVLELPVEATLNITATVSIESEVTINGNNSRIKPTNPGAYTTIRVYYGGNLNLNDAIVSDGNATIGGGISVFNSSLNLNRSTVENNVGGGVTFIGSSGTVNESTITNNTSSPGYAYYGAGIAVSSSNVVISNSTISNNENTATNVGGGGVWATNYRSAPLDLSIVNSTISGNLANNRGAGISHADYGNGSTISLTNVTITNNISGGNGGGISSDLATINIVQSLISGNTGSGGTELDFSGGSITVDDYNLFGLNGNSGVVGVTVGSSDLVPVEATLAEIIDVTLADNGGPTPTHALPIGSPAIDAVFAVPAASCASLTDQTGKARPIDGDADGLAVCDIGAFENPNPDIIFENGFEN
jgi:hypothetical protein